MPATQVMILVTVETIKPIGACLCLHVVRKVRYRDLLNGEMNDPRQ